LAVPQPKGATVPTPEQPPQAANQDQSSSGSASGNRTPLSLLARAQADDGDAWQQLWKLYHPLVLYWCGRGVSAEDAEDLSQEVFGNVARGLKEFRHDKPGDTFRGWLRVITRNAILLHHRRHDKHAQPAGGSEALQALQQVADPLAGCEADEEVEFSRLLRRAMDQVRAEFEEKTWQAFWLTVVDQRKPAALVEETGMSEAGIRQAKARVLRRLKQHVGELSM
jgi:RNA polymerase sigma-70 factor (ECF subfamily)